MRKHSALHPGCWHLPSLLRFCLNLRQLHRKNLVSLVLIIHTRTLPHVVDTVMESLITMGLRKAMEKILT